MHILRLSHFFRAWYESQLSGGSPIVIYLHGNTGSRAREHRLHLYEVLQQLNYHVIAFDYRGINVKKSPPPALFLTIMNICPPFQAMLTPVQLFLPRQRLCMTRTKFMNMWPDWPVNKRKSSFMDTRWEPPSVVSSWLSFAGKTGKMALRGLVSCPGLTTNTIFFSIPFFAIRSFICLAGK